MDLGSAQLTNHNLGQLYYRTLDQSPDIYDAFETICKGHSKVYGILGLISLSIELTVILVT